ncbi:hypothetical protein EV421DRAFT_1839072, partial [Armillaria borealis]
MAVRRPDLKHLINVVGFSCKGSRSLPSCLGGGNLDGDICNIILDVCQSRYYAPFSVLTMNREISTPSQCVYSGTWSIRTAGPGYQTPTKWY